MLWLPFAATVVYALSTVQRKLFLKHSRLDLNVFLPAVALLMAILSIAVAPLDWSVTLSKALSPLYLLGLVAAIGLEAWWFELIFRGTRDESLSRYNLIIAIEPMLVFALAALLFPAERDPRIWLASAIVVTALVIGHWHRNHLRFDRAERTLLLVILLGAVLVILERFLVTGYSPMALNAIYNTGVAFVLIARHGLPRLAHQRSVLLGLGMTAFLIFANQLLYFYSFRAVGATITMFVTLLESILVAVVAYVMLHERLSLRLLVAGVVTLGTIAYTILLVHPS